jgi:hypothetical protein
MPKAYYYPQTEGALLPFLQNLAAKAALYQTALGITPAELSFLGLARDLCSTLTDYANRAQRFAEDWTALKQTCMNGSPNGSPPVWPVWTGSGTAPVGLDTDISGKLRAMIRRWKVAAGYTVPIGEDLGIEGAEETVDPETAQPDLKVNLVAGQPRIAAPRNGFEAVEVEVDRGSGFNLLNVITRTSVKDTHPLPSEGAGTVWRYRAIFRHEGVRVGQWSDVASVPVVSI